MGQALYRKYRSKKLSEIVGQEHITTTLNNALQKGIISHAYLFTGPRGVGKTSIARILAHEINNLPYTDESMHLDIIEIDAASNRRIDEIRDLREKVRSAPTSAKYKVYIIDEVHMLTREAFNALLKTLEEPPKHVVFILATTEAHKVPETIVSRTQRFAFKPIENVEAIEHLGQISKQEDINIEDAALALIAEHGGGSFRDSISLLDQVRTRSKKITLQDVQTVLGIAPDAVITATIEFMRSDRIPALLQHTEDLERRGYQANLVAKQLGVRFRQQIINSKDIADRQRLMKLLEKLLSVPASANPSQTLELILLETALESSQESAKTNQVSGETKINKENPEIETIEAEVAKPTIIEQLPGAPDKLNEAGWQQVLQTLKIKHNTLYGIVRMGKAEFKDDQLILNFAFQFHQKRLNEDKNRQIIREIIKKQTGQSIEIICLVNKDKLLQSYHELPDSDDTLNTISNIFGNAEVIE